MKRKRKKHLLLKEGDVIELLPGMKVYAEIPKHFVYADSKGDFNLTKTDVVLGGEFNYLCGEYIVYKTTYSIPNGHHVWCVNAINEAIKVDFYQTGCFTAMIDQTEIKSIGKARLKWVKE